MKTAMLNRFKSQAKSSLRLFVFTVLAFLLFPALVFGETWYVKSDRTKIQSDASSSSDVIGVLSQGTAVDVLEKTRRFYRISSSEGEGWVFKFKLTRRAPEGASSGGGGGGGLFDVLGGEEQTFAARESSSGSSIRGLNPVTQRYAESHGSSPESINAVNQMENFSVSQGDIDNFLKEGKLGAYGH